VDPDDKLRTQHRALSALVEEQRAICEELAAASERSIRVVREVIAYLRARGLYVEYAGPLCDAVSLVERIRRLNRSN
jgi:hypothetical protein